MLLPGPTRALAQRSTAYRGPSVRMKLGGEKKKTKAWAQNLGSSQLPLCQLFYVGATRPPHEHRVLHAAVVRPEPGSVSSLTSSAICTVVALIRATQSPLIPTRLRINIRDTVFI
ncbi:hypothetical protein NDU88_002422 [Pleurodeles waltl]|uniref:Uncharacterized protein n=1 Tax=Pleurodeles waltl TaxID=8319 RepID=A0AAV7M1F6_PLEWA|nr:hypothetical protein NDU88_002422 [Pleurodeles waltl]